MYGEDEKKDGGSFGSYTAGGGDDGFVKPDFSSADGGNNGGGIFEKDDVTAAKGNTDAGITDTGMTENSVEETAVETPAEAPVSNVGEVPAGIPNTRYGADGNVGRYGNSQGYGNYNGYGNVGGYGSYNGYGNTGRYGNSQGYGNYGSGNTYGNNTVNKNANGESGAKKYWLIPVAVLLCFAMCFGSLLMGMAMVRGSGNVGDGGSSSAGNNGGGSGSLGNGESGENGTVGGNSALLGGGDVELEQLPSSSVYYTIPSVVASTKDSVVEITTETITTGDYWGQYVTKGAGSGVIIRSYANPMGDGKIGGTYIITNDHVISGASTISVKLTNGAEYKATPVATDPQTDIAVIHVNEVDLPVATLGTSAQLVAGQTVVVIGNPLGSLGGSVSSGIISCTERNIEIQEQVMKLIQITAAVNPGNSGGAMFDLEGKLVGIVNAKYSDEQIEGIGFAIPVDIATAVAEDLINYGYVKGRPNHGITTYYGYCTYRNSYVSYDGVRIQGLWASELAAGSDAEAAGMASYDQIVSVIDKNGVTYTFSSVSEADAFFDSLVIGETVTVNVYRYTPVSSFYGTSFNREEFSFTFTVTEYIG